jgi:hypothetical protein
MLNKITNNFAILAAKKLLDSYDSGEISTSKRLLSIIAGAYIFQNALKNIYKHPIIAIQEAVLGGYLLYDAVKGIKDGYNKKPTEASQIRKNQIQGNDPECPVPAFV